jgi:hypothetical protein
VEVAIGRRSVLGQPDQVKDMSNLDRGLSVAVLPLHFCYMLTFCCISRCNSTDYSLFILVIYSSVKVYILT